MARDWAILGSVRGGSGAPPQPAREETPLTPDCIHPAYTWCPHCNPDLQVK